METSYSTYWPLHIYFLEHKMDTLQIKIINKHITRPWLRRNETHSYFEANTSEPISLQSHNQAQHGANLVTDDTAQVFRRDNRDITH